MLTNQDFRDLFVELNAHGVEFLVVGAHALAAHGHVRATKDLDSVDGLTFDGAWPNRVPSEYGGEPVFVISREDLIRNKRAAGRPQDLADIAALENRT